MKNNGIEWPNGAFVWTAQYSKKLPYMRGVRVPDVLIDKTLLKATILFDTQNIPFYKTLISEASERLKTNWILWDKDTANKRINQQALESANKHDWLEILLQCLKIPGRVTLDKTLMPPHTWSIHAAIAQIGLLPTIKIALTLVDAQPEFDFMNGNTTYDSLADPLKQAIILADDQEHAAVIAFLEENASKTKKQRFFRLMCCPHQTVWALESLSEFEKENYIEISNLLRSALPPADANALLQHFRYWMDEVPALLQIHLYGPDANEFVFHAYETSKSNPNKHSIFVDLVGQIKSKQALETLVNDFDNRAVKKTLEKLSDIYPAAVLACMVERIAHNRIPLEEIWTTQLAVKHPKALESALDNIDQTSALYFRDLLPSQVVEESPAEQIPALLSTPPWANKKRATKLPKLDLNTIEEPETITFSDEVTLEKLKQYAPDRRAYITSQDELFNHLSIDEAGASAILSGKTIEPAISKAQGAFSSRHGGYLAHSFLHLPDQAMISLINSAPGNFWGECDTHFWHVMLAKHSTQILPGFIRCIESNIEQGLMTALPVESTHIAKIAVQAFLKSKKAKKPIQNWMIAHPRSTLLAAIPLAFGKAGAVKDAAQSSIRYLIDQDQKALAQAAASEYGASAEKALQALLQLDPLLVLPTRMPSLPGFFSAQTMHKPVLASNNKALPIDSVEHIGIMLALSKPDSLYAGVDQLKAICTGDSLNDFAWDLFNSWLAADAPTKESWALHALGWFGNDKTANKLAPMIRQWPGESQHKRAVSGLDVLAEIGTDTALMHLNAIANKVKFKALKERAKEKIDEVAQNRELTTEQLGDRLVPDLDLDAKGRLDLNFGKRQFQIAFDESLKPIVTDDTGKRLKALPKPRQSDDQALAKAAASQFSQLKKDAKLAASIQLLRMENAMATQRRWPLSECIEFYIKHPLIQHLARRVVWGVYDKNNVLINAFRVAEDQTLTDSQDELLELQSNAIVGIAHPLELNDTLQNEFGTLFGDYEILQPFEQIGRETFNFTETEKKTHSIKRFADRPIASGSIMGLTNKGWERADAEDAGSVNYYLKRLESGLLVELRLDPGMIIGMPNEYPIQHIPEVIIQRDRSANNDAVTTFGNLDVITASELIRDIQSLATAQE